MDDGVEPSPPEGRKGKCQETKDARTPPACRYRSVSGAWRQEGAETSGRRSESHRSGQLTCQRAEPHLPDQKPHSGPEMVGGSESSCRHVNTSTLNRLHR